MRCDSCERDFEDEGYCDACRIDLASDPEAETPTEPVAVVAWWRDTPDVLEAQSTLLSELTAESEAWRKAGEK